MRTIGVVTVARSDYGILRPVIERIARDPELDLMLIAAGMHLAPAYGHTIDEIEGDGYRVDATVEMLLASDSPEGVAATTGLGTIGFAREYARRRPDLLLVLGDRFEVHAAVTAALPFTIPVAHVHGGESTEGLIDEPIRHAITKMSHLHFASTERYARRIVQLGEEPWRVTVSGAPGLDAIAALDPLAQAELADLVGSPAEGGFVLVTYHPVTLEYEKTAEQVAALVTALERVDRPVVITHPNADTARGDVLRALEAFAAARENAVIVPSAGSRAYLSLMAHADAMVGNSSSGIIEAASFKLPVVNIGIRQRGRVRADNVIDSDDGAESISAAIDQALSADFRSSLNGLQNPYGDGAAAARIVDRLRDVDLDSRLLVKRFHDLDAG